MSKSYARKVDVIEIIELTQTPCGLQNQKHTSPQFRITGVSPLVSIFSSLSGPASWALGHGVRG